MLRVISFIISMLVLALVLIFVFENVSKFGTTPVSIRYHIWHVYNLEPVDIPVWALLLFMFGAGMVVTFFLELMGWLKLRTRSIQQKRAIKNLEKELDDYRSRYGITGSSGPETPS